MSRRAFFHQKSQSCITNTGFHYRVPIQDYNTGSTIIQQYPILPCRWSLRPPGGIWQTPFCPWCRSSGSDQNDSWLITQSMSRAFTWYQLHAGRPNGLCVITGKRKGQFVLLYKIVCDNFQGVGKSLNNLKKVSHLSIVRRCHKVQRPQGYPP